MPSVATRIPSISPQLSTPTLTLTLALANALTLSVNDNCRNCGTNETQLLLQLRLCGAPARQLSARGKGIAAIAEMLNVTRMYVAVPALNLVVCAPACLNCVCYVRAGGTRLLQVCLVGLWVDSLMG